MAWLRKEKVNNVVLTMVYADFLLVSATGFLSPISAVYITTQIAGASLSTVGFVTMLFWVVKSATQIPVSSYVDARRGERDDFQFMIVGCIISAVVPLLYYFYVRETWQLFAVETLNGVGYAMQVPTWLAIFTRHIDKHRESTEWTLHSNAIGLGFAATAAFGGVLADRFGFRVLFLLVSAVMFMGTVALLFIKDEMLASDGREIPQGYAINQEKQKIRS
ncbi:MAG TPA: MFS transporter [Candidatus Binatia bacterium]|jgi:MFS family permease|nr:MFS transporter [Candidatus Binatia bacterium]